MTLQRRMYKSIWIACHIYWLKLRKRITSIFLTLMVSESQDGFVNIRRMLQVLSVLALEKIKRHLKTALCKGKVTDVCFYAVLLCMRLWG